MVGDGALWREPAVFRRSWVWHLHLQAHAQFVLRRHSGKGGLLIRVVALLVGSISLLALGLFAGLAWNMNDEASGPGGPPPGKGTGGAASSAYPGPDAESDLTPVVTAPALLASIRERISGTGLLEAERTVTVIARVDGEVQTLKVEQSDEIQAGAVLCEIDPQTLEIAERQARIQHDHDVTEHERMLDLSKQLRPVVSSKEVEDARFAKEQSGVAHERALLDLSHARPPAPFDGVVIQRFVNKGQYVRAGDSLFTIGDFRPLLVRLFLPESDVRRIEVGQLAELRPERAGPALVTGEVLRVSPVVDAESLNVEVTVSFAQVPAPLRPGSFVRIDIITQTHEDVVLVPRAAVLRLEDQPTHLYRLLGNQVQKLAVETGYEDESVVEIRESALSAGDIVIVEGNRELKENDRVQEYRRVPVRGNPLSVTPKE